MALNFDSPPHSRGMIVAMHIYADESGKASNSPTVSCAGFVSDVEQWCSFDRRWKETATRWCINSIHTAELMKQDLIYRGHAFTDHPEKPKLLAECLSIANESAPIAFGVAVDCNAFKTLNSDSQKKLGGDSHMMAFLAFMHLLVSTLDQAKTDGIVHRKISLVFDTNNEYSSRCLDLFNRQRQNYPEWRQWLSSICFGDDEDHSPIQAADILSWLISQKIKGVPPDTQYFVSPQQIDDLASVAIHGLAGGEVYFDADALRVLDQEMRNGAAFKEIVKVRIEKHEAK
ncbi:MAG: DUF3800 domain-containing protein [Terracidiphilus sp.]|jgi:hypothetical protein